MTTNRKRAALYLRVSTDGQETSNQRMALEAVAERRGWEVIATYEDAGISGAKGRDKRPGFDLMLKDATRRRFDILMFWSIDRLGRSTAAVATTLAELETAGIIIYADKQAIDATTAYGKAMLHMAATFAELERDVIRDRVKAGIARVRQEIREGGEPEIKARLARGKKNIGRPPVAKETAAKAREYLGQGHGIIRVAKQLGIGVGTVQKIKRAAQAGAATLPAGSGYAAA